LPLDITFKTKALEKCANKQKEAVKKLGQHRANKFRQRLDDLRAVESLEDMRYLPGRTHELKGDRKGLWALDLDHPYRLIIEPHEDPIPEDENGSYLWIEIKGIEVVDITDYH